MNDPPQFPYDDDRYEPEPFGEPVILERPDPHIVTRNVGWITLVLAGLLAGLFLVLALQPPPRPPARPATALDALLPPQIEFMAGALAARAAFQIATVYIVSVMVSMFAIVLSGIAARGPTTSAGRKSAVICLACSSALLAALIFSFIFFSSR